MVLQNGSIQKDKEQSGFLARCVARFRSLVQLFKGFGSEDAESKLVIELADLTEKDELVWEFRKEEIEVFESCRNGIALRLEITPGGPILFTTNSDIKNRVTKNKDLNLLVNAIFKQKARYRTKEEVKDFDPDEEFKKVLLPKYKEFLKDRPE